MIKSDFWARVLGGFIFYRWHPEVALRYLPAVSKINTLKPNATVLEVGSGGIGIGPYLKRKVVGIDIHFEKPYHPLLTRVKGEATKLPFENESFDIVVSMDMLEHIPTKKRGDAVREIVRVAKSLVIIGVPCGEEAQEDDRLLYNEYTGRLLQNYKYYDEQLAYGLPKILTMTKYISRALLRFKKKGKITAMGNESINIHRFLMRGWMRRDFLSQVFFRKILLFAIPLLRNLNNSPTYRTIFTVDLVS